MQRGLAWGGLVVALVLGAALRWTLPADVQDLRPRPDALEYEEAARSLAAGEGYCLHFDGACWPPRYPPGLSLLLVPAMWLTGDEVGGGIWSVLAWALAGIAAVWALGLATGGPASAVAAALLLASAPLHVRWSRAVMSDVPAATLLTLLALGAVRLLSSGGRPRAWALLGALAGGSALLRPALLVAAPPILLALAATGRAWEGRRLLAFAGGVVAGLAPSALYGFLRFGSPLASGYEYWVAADFFAWRHLVEGPAGGGIEPNLVFYARQLAGLGALYPWPTAVLAGAGLVLGLAAPGSGRYLAWIAGGTLLGLVALHLPFFWQWDRFLLPALPLLLACAALPLGTPAPRSLRLAGLVLTGFVLAGPWFTPDAFAPPDWPLGETRALQAIAGAVEPNAVLLAHGNALLVARVFRDGTDRLWIPIGRCEHRQLVRKLGRQPVRRDANAENWLWDVLAAAPDGGNVDAVVEALSAAGRPVYFAPLLGDQSPLVDAIHAKLVNRCDLEIVPTRPPTGLVRVRPRSR